MNYSLHLTSRLTLILCTVGILPAISQQQEKELQLNMDAVKMIQFDFNSLPKQENQPLEAPLNKKWMDFKVDLKVPRSLIDTTKVWKPESSAWNLIPSGPVSEKTRCMMY